MKIKVVLLKAWSLHEKGKTLLVDKPIADLLIQSGRAKAMEETKPQGKQKRPVIDYAS